MRGKGAVSCGERGGMSGGRGMHCRVMSKGRES